MSFVARQLQNPTGNQYQLTVLDLYQSIPHDVRAGVNSKNNLIFNFFYGHIVGKTLKINKYLIVAIKVTILILIFFLLWNNLRKDLDYNVWLSHLSVHYNLFLLLLFFLIINMGIEVVKWNTILNPDIQLTKKESISSVLVGYTIGFLMPNRVGAFLGRILFLYPEKRYEGSVKSIYNSLSQLLITLLTGFVSVLYISIFTDVPYFDLFSVVLFLPVLVLLHFIYFLPRIPIRFLRKFFSDKLKHALDAIDQVPFDKRLQVYVLSFLRYLVFVVQFLLALYIFEVEISFNEAVVGIMLTFLLTSMVPVFFFGKILIRESVAIFVFSIWKCGEVQIFYATTLIWLVNLVIPSLTGAFILLIHKIKTR